MGSVLWGLGYLVFKNKRPLAVGAVAGFEKLCGTHSLRSVRRDERCAMNAHPTGGGFSRVTLA